MPLWLPLRKESGRDYLSSVVVRSLSLREEPTRRSANHTVLVTAARVRFGVNLNGCGWAAARDGEPLNSEELSGKEETPCPKNQQILLAYVLTQPERQNATCAW